MTAWPSVSMKVVSTPILSAALSNMRRYCLYPFPVRHIPKVSDFGQAERLSLVRLRVVRVEEEEMEAQKFIERSLKAGDGIAFDLRDHAIGELLDEIGRRRRLIPAIFVRSKAVA